MQDRYFSLHPFSDILKFDGAFSLKVRNRSIDSIRISERMVSTPLGSVSTPSGQISTPPGHLSMNLSQKEGAAHAD